MIITFCGHSQFLRKPEYEEMLLNYLEKTVGDKCASVYLGKHGQFDAFSYHCCKKYKKTHPNVSLVFVTPYLPRISPPSIKEALADGFDEILYPGLENVPPKLAILYRNRYMVDQADVIVTYITHPWGGAYTTYLYAVKKGKPIFHLVPFEKNNHA